MKRPCLRHLSCHALLIFVLAFALPCAVFGQPVATTDLMFSTDDGATFSDVATVDEMQNFIARVYFDNTGDAPGTGAAVSLTLPAGFIQVSDSTRVCLEPTDGETVCNDDVGQTGAIDENSVWSGQVLTISPTAGVYGQSATQTSGLLEIGKSRYFNLHDCHYFNGAERFYTSADPDIAGTNMSNDLDAVGVCAGVVGAYGNAGQELRSSALLGQRYLNLHECHYNFFTDHIYRVTDGTGTTTSNTADVATNCAGTAGAHILHPDSVVSNFDLFGRRYLNLWECRYISGGDLISVNFEGSNTSDIADGAPSCAAALGAYTLNDSDLLALDTLDTTRGRGFVEVEVMAPAMGGDFDLDAALSGNEFATENDTGTVTVIATAIPAPIPSIDLMYFNQCDGDTSADASDDITAYIDEQITARIYFDNMGDAPGTDAQITTTLPAGVTLVPGTTRVCLSPTDGETVCNDDAGQGGAIDETAVWTGSDLAIAPSAGVAGEDPDAASGTLDIGRKRYLNMHECHYYDGFSDRLFLYDAQGTTGTNAANTVDAMATCQAMAHGRTLVSGVVSSYDLLAQRYFNLHECQYHFFFADRIFLTGADYTGTGASNQLDTTISCAPSAGSHMVLEAESSLAGFDLLGQRYFNLHECVMLNGVDHIGISGNPAVGTNASNTADESAQCPASSGAHTLVVGSVNALDLLDNARGRGYVEFQVTVSETMVDLTQTVEMSSLDFATETDTGTIFANTANLFNDGFECGNFDGWDEVFP